MTPETKNLTPDETPGNQVLPAAAVAIQHPHCNNFCCALNLTSEKT
jgi:hypothetical protein